MYFQRIIWFITGVFISSCSEETFTREFCLQNVPKAEIQKTVPISSTSVFVNWTITGALTGISLEYIGPTLSGTKNIQLPGQNGSYEIKDLLPFTNYSVTITPVCKFEEGMSSNGKPDSKTVRTLCGVPSVPTEIKVLSVLPNNVRLIWKKPRETRGEIAGYCVDYMTDPPGIDGNTKCTESNETRITLSGLLPGQKYHVTVYAFNYNEETNEKIYGNHSKTNFTTKVEAPGEPQNIQAITVESRKIVLKWDALEHKGENMIKYNVTCKTEELEKTNTTNATSITFHDLTPWTEYYVEVKGIVQVKEKELPGPAATISIRTDKDGPSQPQNFSTTFINSSAVSLEWDAPSQPNGEPIVYLLKYRSDANDPEEQTRTERTHATINNLKCNTEYIFQLAAYNTLKNGTEIIGTNITLNVTTDTQAPGKPTDIELIKAEGAGVKLSWKAPESICGNVSGYKIKLESSDEQETFSEYFNMTYFSATNITSGTQYQISISAFTESLVHLREKYFGETVQYTFNITESIQSSSGSAIPSTSYGPSNDSNATDSTSPAPSEASGVLRVVSVFLASSVFGFVFAFGICILYSKRGTIIRYIKPEKVESHPKEGKPLMDSSSESSSASSACSTLDAKNLHLCAQLRNKEFVQSRINKK